MARGDLMAGIAQQETQSGSGPRVVPINRAL